MRIRDTLSLGHLEVSESCLEDARPPGLEVLRAATPIRFDDAGNLLALD